MDYGQSVTFSIGMSLAQLEKMAIMKTFHFFRMNKTLTSNALGICVKTLDNKLKQYDEEEKQFAEKEAEQKRKAHEFLQRARGVVPDNVYVGESANPDKQVGKPVVHRQDGWERNNGQTDKAKVHTKKTG